MMWIRRKTSNLVSNTSASLCQIRNISLIGLISSSSAVILFSNQKSPKTFDLLREETIFFRLLSSVEGIRLSEETGDNCFIAAAVTQLMEKWLHLLAKLTNDNPSPQFRPQTRDERQRTTPQKETFLLRCFTKRTDANHMQI